VHYVRVIPCLLLRGTGFVKTVRFRDPTYLGDPLNTLKIFNEKEVDEVIVLDIAATREGKGPNYGLIGEMASECFMPLTYGGGIRTVQEAERILQLGVEKVSLNAATVERPELITDIAQRFGSQSVVVSIDVKRKTLGGREVVTRGGTVRTGLEPVAFARHVESRGAGEVLLTSVDRDGTMSGYDLELTRQACSALTIPLVACGGAGSIADLGAAVKEGQVSAVAAGSLFVFHGPHRAVLISFPSRDELDGAFS
jgi:cyclase